MASFPHPYPFSFFSNMFFSIIFWPPFPNFFFYICFPYFLYISWGSNYSLYIINIFFLEIKQLIKLDNIWGLRQLSNSPKTRVSTVAWIVTSMVLVSVEHVLNVMSALWNLAVKLSNNPFFYYSFLVLIKGSLTGAIG